MEKILELIQAVADAECKVVIEFNEIKYQVDISVRSTIGTVNIGDAFHLPIGFMGNENYIYSELSDLFERHKRRKQFEIDHLKGI